MIDYFDMPARFIGMSNESHIDFKEFDSRRNLEVERLYGKKQRELAIAIEALEDMAEYDDPVGSNARKALDKIKASRDQP
jgi:hypothetical protein